MRALQSLAAALRRAELRTTVGRGNGVSGVVSDSVLTGHGNARSGRLVLAEQQVLAADGSWQDT
jgi:hypothetical protein